MNSDYIPQELVDKCVNYFGNDGWFYIKHPQLNYNSPITYIKNTGDLEEIEKVLEDDMLF